MKTKAQLLEELEAEIDQAQCQMYEAMKQIKDEVMWPEVYEDFWEYLKVRFGYSRSWYSQLQANYNALAEMDIDVPFRNEYAKRVLREAMPELRQAVYNRAVAVATGHGDSVVSAAHIKAVSDATVGILVSGYADDGDGSMIAADVQIDNEYQEAVLRRRVSFSSKIEWRQLTYTGGTPFVIPDIPTGKTVEIKWGIIETKESEQ